MLTKRKTPCFFVAYIIVHKRSTDTQYTHEPSRLGSDRSIYADVLRMYVLEHASTNGVGCPTWYENWSGAARGALSRVLKRETQLKSPTTHTTLRVSISPGEGDTHWGPGLRYQSEIYDLLARCGAPSAGDNTVLYVHPYLDRPLDLCWLRHEG